MRLPLVLALALSATLLAGCASNSGASTGTLRLQVTDAPDAIGDFSALNVTVEKITLTAKDGKDKDYEPSNGTFDLTRLVNGNMTSLFAGKVDAGNYTKLTLHVKDAKGTLKSGGQSVDVKAPSGQLFVNGGFEVAEGKETSFVFDIQVHQQGNGGYIFQPNATGSGPVNAAAA